MSPTGVYPRPTLQERLWRFIDASGDCWEWVGEQAKGGYGRISTGSAGRRTHTLAHRAVWETLVGPIPDGLTIDHLCRNRRCVNPDHLEPVTFRENCLRGYGVGARAARKTHCPKGHAYAGTNLVGTERHRECRSCRRERERIVDRGGRPPFDHTVCRNGHAYTPDNTLETRHNRCRMCRQGQLRRWRDRHPYTPSAFLETTAESALPRSSPGRRRAPAAGSFRRDQQVA